MPKHLRSLPDQPERGLGMIRVSKERDGMVSPDVQRIAITDWAARTGVEITGWLEGLDESGSRARSAWWPRLEQAVTQVEAGVYDVIVVWKYSRVARNRLKWATAVDRVEQAGGRIESATEQVDTATSTGRFTRGMLAELQAFEAERIGEVWREVHSRRVATGRPATGKPKFGYTYDRVTKLHVPDPVTGPVLAEAYRRYVAGATFHQLVRWLNDTGHPTTAGGVWTDVTLRRVLDAGFATGRFRHDGDLVDGVHAPLISREVWEAYIDRRMARRALAPTGERSQYLLSRLLRCGRCGGPMVAGQFAANGTPSFRCSTAKAKGRQGCAGAIVQANIAEQAVHDWLTHLAGAVDQEAGSVAEVDARRATLAVDRDRLARQISRTEEALTRLVVQHATDPSPPDVYRAAHSELTAQLERLRAQLEDSTRDHRRLDLDPPKVAAGLLEEWLVLPLDGRREVLRTLIDHVTVHPGQQRGPSGRIESTTRCVITATWATHWPS